MRGVLTRLVAAGAAGVAAGLAFPPVGFWWLLPLAVAALAVTTRGLTPRRALLCGLVFGLPFMLVLLPWLQVIGVDAWVGLCVLESLFYGLLGWGLARVGSLPGWPVWQACLWVAVESLRGVIPWGGFNWGRLAFASPEAPVAEAVSVIGVAGVSFLVALAGTLLAYAVVRRAPVPSLAAVAGAAALLLLPAVVIPWTMEEDPALVTVAVVQGDVPGEGMNPFSERRAVLNNHVQATLDLARRVADGEVPQPDLVIWPENSTDIDPFIDSTVMADISRAVDVIDAPTLVGAMVQGPEPINVKNKGIVWLPGQGPTDDYAKMHPVPFGEYIPMRKLLARYIERLDQIPRDMVPGTEYGVLDLGPAVVGDVICFEVIYDDLIRTLVDRGADLLVVQTNNATYMGTGQVEQQFAISRLRAMETRRYVAVAATNGISAIVDPSGVVVEQAPQRTQRVLLHQVPKLSAISPAVRYGAFVEQGLLCVGLLALAASVLVLRRRTDSREPTGEPAEVGASKGEV